MLEGGTGGLWMLLAMAALLVLTGLPAWMLLIGVASTAAGVGLFTGQVDVGLLTALPARLLGLLENDLLQALPLYVLVGVLLHRSGLVETWFRVGSRLAGRGGAGSDLAAMGIGALLAPMNGSVGASVAMLGRTLLPRLAGQGVERGAALVCVAGTLGVVVPPSLVLVLLGDAMMRAHTEAINRSGALVRIINTQDVFHGALPAAGLFFTLCLLITAWVGRGRSPADEAPSPARREWLLAGITAGLIVALLSLVAAGRLYAVEAAATGGFALFVFAVSAGRMSRETLADVLRETLALTGALMALLVAATSFTLVVRAFGTDRWVVELFAGLGGGETAALTLGLGILAGCALVLDAFELIFVVIPVVMPALLTRVPDATWVAVLALLVLQASFLLPPLGYALLVVRHSLPEHTSTRRIVRWLLPYLVAQLVTLGVVLAFPGFVSCGPESRAAPAESGGAGDDLSTLLQHQQSGQ